MASSRYQQLVLIVEPSGSGKTSTLRSVPRQWTPCINVNLQLSRVLMEVPPRERPLRVQRLLDDLIQPGTAPALLDNLELLFDPVLQVQALGWLQRLSRGRRVVATWNGSVEQAILSTRGGEPEYRRERAADTLTIICPGPGGAQ